MLKQEFAASSSEGVNYRLSWLVVALAVLLVLVFPRTALAHTQLESTDPVEGSVVASAPPSVTFTFNEPVEPVAESFVLLDATGESHSLPIAADRTQIKATFPEGLADGTVIVGWRVTSADGHPVSGALSFSIGTPGTTPALALPETATDPWVERALGLAQGFGYLGLLTAAGLVTFHLLVASAGVVPQRSTWRLAVWAAVLSIAGTALALPLTVARQQGLWLGDLAALDRWTDMIDSREMRELVVLAAGLGIAVVAVRSPATRGSRVSSAAGVTLAVISPALAGHTNSFDPVWVFRLSNVLHTLAGALWLGGLIGLVMLLKRQRQQPEIGVDESARVVSRFSVIAGGVLAALVLSGVISAWITLDAVDGLWSTTYGRLVLIKAGLVGVVGLVAAWNHFRLVPAIEANASEPGAWSHLRRAVVAEVVLLCVVALITGFLVDQSPVATAASTSNTPPSVARFDTALGDGRVSGSIDPAAAGPSLLTFTLTDVDGNPIEPIDVPDVALSLRSSDIGPLTTTAIAGEAPGTFTAEIQFPSRGLWDIEIPVRVSRFEEMTAKLTVEIR